MVATVAIVPPSIRARSGVVAALLVAVTLLAGCGSGVPAPPQGIGTPLDETLPASIRALHLVDSTGRTRTLASLTGRIVVLQPSMTLCQETCPMDTAALVDAARRTAAAGLGTKVVFVSATVDPQRDTVPQIAAYRRLYGAPADWLTLTGKPAALNALWDKLGVYRKRVPSSSPAPRNWRTGAKLTYDVQHSDDVFFLDARGHERFVIEGMPAVNRGGIPKKLHSFLSDQGLKNLHSSGDWTAAQALSVVSWLADHQIPA